MKEEELQDELASIRNMMERSSKFISLSGLSGILAGIYALLGAAFAYHIICGQQYQLSAPLPPDLTATPRLEKFIYGGVFDSEARELLLVALAVLIASITTGLVLSIRKGKRKEQQVWGKTSKALLFHMAVPLVTGGLLILILIYRGHYSIAAPMSLIFYGIALIGASNFTFNDVKYLGLSEIALGLIAACMPGYGLIFWSVGFGILHIIYGSVMYLKYDR